MMPRHSADIVKTRLMMPNLSHYQPFVCSLCIRAELHAESVNRVCRRSGCPGLTSCEHLADSATPDVEAEAEAVEAVETRWRQ